MAWLGGSCFRSLMRVESMPARVTVIWRLGGVGHPGLLSHIQTQSKMAGGRGWFWARCTDVPLQRGSLRLFTYQLASSRASDPREKEQGKKATMSCRALEVRLYSIDHIDQPWYLWERITQGQEYQRQGSLGSTLKAGYHSSLAFHQLTLLFSFPVDTLVRLLRARLREPVWPRFSGGLVYESWEYVEVMG